MATKATSLRLPEPMAAELAAVARAEGGGPGACSPSRWHTGVGGSARGDCEAHRRTPLGQGLSKTPEAAPRRGRTNPQAPREIKRGDQKPPSHRCLKCATKPPQPPWPESARAARG